MLNKVMIIGRLGKDPETKDINGATVCNMSIATSNKWKNKNGEWQEETEWHKVNVWGNAAKPCEQYLKKGSQVFVEGEIKTRSWEDAEGVKKYSTEIRASKVKFLDSKEQETKEEIPF